MPPKISAKKANSRPPPTGLTLLVETPATTVANNPDNKDTVPLRRQSGRNKVSDGPKAAPPPKKSQKNRSPANTNTTNPGDITHAPPPTPNPTDSIAPNAAGTDPSTRAPPTKSARKPRRTPAKMEAAREDKRLAAEAKHAAAEEKRRLADEKRKKKVEIQQNKERQADLWKTFEKAQQHAMAAAQAHTVYSRQPNPEAVPEELEDNDTCRTSADDSDSYEFIHVNVSIDSDDLEDLEEREGNGEADLAEVELTPEVDIEGIQSRIQALKIDSRKKKGAGKSAANALPLASGLTTARDRQERASIAARGLADEDVEGNSPFVNTQPPLVTGRRNLQVTIVRDVVPRPFQHPITPPRIKKLAEVQHTTTSRPRAPAATKPPTSAQITTSTNANVFPSRPNASTTIAAVGSKLPVPGNTRSDQLPPFVYVDNAWKARFLPTLTHVLFTSEEPFKGFASGTPKLREHLQLVVNAVYPDSDYRVQLAGDTVHNMACNRISDRRGNIGQEALKAIIKHLMTFRDPEEASKWLSWARRVHGLLYFETPTPIDHKKKPGEEGFQRPRGRLQSPFIIMLARKAFEYTEGAVTIPQIGTYLDCKRPIGLFALIMAALDRASQLLEPDGSIKTGQNHQRLKNFNFSDENWGAVLESYVISLRKVNDETWKVVLNDCLPSKQQLDHDDHLTYNTSITDLDRQDMFCFESPQKPSY
ncbi:hypothetical protein FA15DRAFT_710890 [Coprinopsis marcescibilis]|uniref:Uncharacterized protein n=1 Tax=Coprinopsis marcescibilis TaxID=230819 RepID=A0A5C3KBR7_COPMA|nr:hypothetical protein FA15DRAFT_710890 [Coprinopsis marcescibilis]